jgi:hypothetical protein
MLSGVIGNANTALNAVKTAVDNRVGAVLAVADNFKNVLNNAKAKIVDSFDTMPKVVANVEKIINELDIFFETNTIKLEVFVERRNNLIGVINALKAQMKVDTHTHQNVKIKYEEQIRFCETLFNEYKEVLDIILKYHSMISPIIIELLRINKENKMNSDNMTILTGLRKRLQGYNEKLLGYLFPQCIEKLFGGGSSKKTNKKKNILGRERCIYKKSGDRKEYLKYKGDLITVKEYKIIMRTVANHR